MPGVLRPVDAQQQAEGDLDVDDALAYLDLVKYKFINQPQVYEDFMDIFQEFKRMTIDTPGVMARMSSLFAGHPELLVGFNMFLPPGCEFVIQINGQVLLQEQLNHSAPPVALGYQSPEPAPLAVPPGVNPWAAQLPAEEPFEEYHAVSYIMQVKHRFNSQPQVYNNFVLALMDYRNRTINDQTFNTRVLNLFEGHPDLIVGFQQFFPVVA